MKHCGGSKNFRDEVLSKSAAGRECIKLYYQLSPALVRAMAENKAFKREVKEILDLIVPLMREEIQ